jgi:class 3 adenylate cyclase
LLWWIDHDDCVEIPETQYVTVGDAQIAYQVLGEGPVDLVFNHGHCHIDVHWELEPEAEFFFKLASFTRLILFDRRGSGASDRVENGGFPTWEEWNQDLLAVLDAVGSKTSAIFGEYEAGPLAVLFAATHPDRVTSLILGNTTAKYGYADDYQIGIPIESIDARVEMLQQYWGTPAIASAFPSIADDPRICAQVAKVCRASATPRAAAAQARYVYSELDARSSLPLVRVPTLVLVNRNTPTQELAALARDTASRIEGSKFVEFDGVDSMFFVGPNAGVIAEVSEFLTGEREIVEPDRILATLLFSDIVGSTERAVTDGDHRWRNLLDAHDEVVRLHLAKFKGREVKHTGDGVLATFDGPARAVRCAKAIVERIRQLGIEVRIGLHTGECEVRGDDLAGLAIHIASRVMGSAAPSEIWVTHTVKDLVAGSDLTFAELGEFSLKGVPDRWRLFSVSDI